MSYIINNTNPFITTKLTQVGREKLAQGKLTFTSWAIGDSEVNYDRESLLDNSTISGNTRIMRPVDNQPNIKYFLSKTNSSTPLNNVDNSIINVVKATVNNEALERGFFSGTPFTYTTLTGSTYIESVGVVPNTNLTGGTTFLLSSGTTRSVGDLVLLKLTNDTVVGQTDNSNEIPLPNLWYKIISTTTNSVTVDRELPNLSNETVSSSQVFIYKGGEVYENFGSNTTSYWDTGTLSFDNSQLISCDDVPVWNMNNVFCETMIGTTGVTTNVFEGYENYGSYDYIGVKNPYFEYLSTTNQTQTDLGSCGVPGSSVIDDFVKSISVLHYTNNTISNFYGEFLFIDTTNDKVVKIQLPDLMYHRRNFQTGSGTSMGMTFISSGATKFVGNSNISYVDLIEDPTLVSGEPLIVGRVYPNLKTVVIHDDEIVAAISYKSNRNWTLPNLTASLSNPSGGTSTGVLLPNETIYLTYLLDNNSTGLTTSLPCQKFVKLTNNTSTAKDITFNISNVDLLPYMRKIESPSYDGIGFYAYGFKLLYQIVSGNDRPSSDSWNILDFTSTNITENVNETINPVLLENQSPLQNGFNLTLLNSSGSTTFELNYILNLAPISNPEILQFGDERFFYGNLQTYIGATIYKTIFDIRVNGLEFTKTSNPTYDSVNNSQNIKVSEIGIYDSDNNLVLMGKLSYPMPIATNQTVIIEMSIDF